MRVSWNQGRVATALAATVVALLGAGSVCAQFTQEGARYQNQPQNALAQPQSDSRYGVQSSAAPQQVPTPRYTAMAYFGETPPTAESVQAALDQGAEVVEQSAPIVQQNTFLAPSSVTYDYFNTYENRGNYRYGSHRQHCGGAGCMQGCGGCDGCGRCCPKWFGGVYGLVMERDNATRLPLGFATASAPPYYPSDSEVALTTDDSDVGYQGGFEVRFGAHFGGPSHAWEAVYWGMFDDSESSTLTDVAGTRTYGMIDFTGLEYDPGTGFRDVNVWFDYGPPTADNSAPFDVEVRALRARNTFQAHNLEANLLYFPLLRSGYRGPCSSRYELNTVLGFRFMRIDDDFLFRSDYEDMNTNALGYLAYDVQADNRLYGFQIGSNGTCRVGRRFAVHYDSAVGLYGNHISVTQRMNSPAGGTVRLVNGGSTFSVENDKEDVSVLGELRIGASYYCHPQWRIYAGWRLVGITGVALSTEQIPTVFNTPGQIGAIDSNDSLILHGLRTGMEFLY